MAEFDSGMLLVEAQGSESADQVRRAARRHGRRKRALALVRDLGTESDRPSEPITLPDAALQRLVTRALSGPYLSRAERLDAHSMPETSDTDRHRSARSVPDHNEAARSASADEPWDGFDRPGVPGDPEPAITPLALSVSFADRQPGDTPPVWGSVPPRNPNFTGRDALIEQLRSQLTANGSAAVLPTALYGMGGVGKTQTAAEYVYRHLDDYDLVWWIQSAQPAQIRSGVVELARHLGLRGSAAAHTAVPAVLETLRRGNPIRRWILVFDDAESPEAVWSYFPTSGPGEILVTSRNPSWSGIARALEIPPFQRKESKELLLRRGPDIGDRDADRLSEALGDLPLAVDRTAAWRSETGMPVPEFLDLLDEKVDEILDTVNAPDYEVPVAAAWNLSIDKLRVRNPPAYQLLHVCAHFSPEPISRNLFTGTRALGISPELDETLRDPIQFARAIRDIIRPGLAKIHHHDNTIQMHRLVQSVLRARLDRAESERMRHSVHLMLANGDPGDPENSADWSVYAGLLPHAVTSRVADCHDSRVRGLVANLNRYLANVGASHGALIPNASGCQTDRVSDSPPARVDDVPARRSDAGNLENSYQTVCFLDIAGYGGTRRTWPDYTILRDGMHKCVKRAFAQAEISWDSCYTESVGDEILILAPTAVPRSAFVGPMLTALADALREHNETHPSGQKMELRLALHAGEIARDEMGPIGPAIVHARRLLDAAPLKKALAKSSGPLAVIASEWFYNEVVWQRSEYGPDAYRKAVVQVKETDGFGWIRLFD